MARLLATLAAIVLCFGLAVVPPALADPARRSTPPPASDLYLGWLSGWQAPASGAGDLFRIGLDPETGEWGRAPVDQALQVSAIMAPPLVFHRADGTIEVILDPRIVDYFVARLGPDGRPAFDCVPNGTLAPALSVPAISGAPDR